MSIAQSAYCSPGAGIRNQIKAEAGYRCGFAEVVLCLLSCAQITLAPIMENAFFGAGTMGKMSRTAFKIFLLTAAATLTPIAGQACEYGYCWGAVGFGPDGAAGHSTMQSTVPDAENLAQIACGEKCTAMEVFNDTCAAIAETQDGTSVLGFGKTRSEAADQVYNICKGSVNNCVIRASACSLKF